MGDMRARTLAVACEKSSQWHARFARNSLTMSIAFQVEHARVQVPAQESSHEYVNIIGAEEEHKGNLPLWQNAEAPRIFVVQSTTD